MDHDALGELSTKQLWALFEENEDVDQGEVGIVLAGKLNHEGNYTEAIAVSEIVVALGEKLANNAFLAEGNFRIGWANFSLGRYDESYQAYKACVQYFLQDGMEYAAATSIGNAIDGLLEMDKYQDAFELSLEGFNLAKQVDATRQIGFLGRQYIRACMALGELDEIVRVAPEVIDAFSRINDAEEVVRVRELFADALTDNQMLEASLEVWKENAKVARVLEMYSFEGNAILKQAQILLQMGETARALPLAERALEFCLERKLLWLAAKAHWLIADSRTKSRKESLAHLDEGIAIIRTTSGADGSLYCDLLTSKVDLTMYSSEFAHDFFTSANALLEWSERSSKRIRTRLFAQVRLFERFLDDSRYEDAVEMNDLIHRTLSDIPEEDRPLWTMMAFGSCELQLLLHEGKFDEVVEKGLVFLSTFAEYRTQNFQIAIAYETVGDAYQALQNSQATEMWRNALILFSYMTFEVWAETVAKKLLDDVSVPGQLF